MEATLLTVIKIGLTQKKSFQTLVASTTTSFSTRQATLLMLTLYVSLETVPSRHARTAAAQHYLWLLHGTLVRVMDLTHSSTLSNQGPTLSSTLALTATP